MSKQAVPEHRYRAVGGPRHIGGEITATYSTWFSGWKALLIIDSGGQKSLAAQGVASALALLALAAPFMAGYPNCTVVAEGIAFYFFFAAVLASIGLFVDEIRDRVGFFAAFFAPAAVVTSVFYIVLWANMCHV